MGAGDLLERGPNDPAQAGEPRSVAHGAAGERPVGDAAAGSLRWRRPLRALRWAILALRAAVVLTLLVVGLLRWVDPPLSAVMLRHAYNVWRLDQPTPYFHHQWVPLREISPALRLAALAAEDQRFPDHDGFDWIEIRHAWADYRAGGRLRGASTISQQTAKNLFLWPGQDWLRKGLEAWLTVFMELLWPKERILEVYLNIAQFGPNTYGVEAASQRYFGQPASTLGLDDAALLISVLPAPGLNHIDQPSEQMQRRAAWILDQTGRLGGTGYLDRL